MAVKLAHIVLGMEPGGIENLIVNMARQIDRKSFDMTVGCLDVGGFLLNDINMLGFNSFILKRKPGLDWKSVLSLARIFIREKFDIVHTHNEAPHFYGGLAAKLAGIPCLITTEHSRHYIDDNYERRRLQKLLMSKITDQWVTVSEELARLSVEKDGLSPEKVVAVPNGIDVERFIRPIDISAARWKNDIGIPENAKVAIMVARLNPIKNHELFIRALAELKDMTDVHAVFVGDGELLNTLTQLTKFLGLENKIHFLGYRQDIEKFLWISDVFVLCSKTEGLPLCLLEAMAAKVPILITDTANRAGLITHGVNGQIAENNVKSLATALTNALKDTVYYKKMAEKGFDFVKEHYSLKTMMSRYQCIYERILKEKSNLKNA